MAETLKQLRSFRSVAETGSFTEAAQGLGLSQPVVSGHVRDLETTLGLPLLTRTTRKIALTEEGRAYLAEVCVVLDRLEQARARVRLLAETRAARLVIAAPPVLAATLLPPVMARFAGIRPEVRLSLLDVPTGAMREALAAGRVDAAVGTFDPGIPTATRLQVLRDRLMAFVPADNPLSRRGALGWADLAEADLILLRPPSGIRGLVDAQAAREGVTLQPRHEVVNVMTVLAMVEAGLGAAILPSYAATGLGARAIRAVDLAGSPAPREIAFVTPAGRPAPPAATEFARLLRREARRLTAGKAE
ncbi:LysR family transcriptional regulator [Roseibacterium sp. SDUM158016]|uniref:LysR family transcriptional regulator n=1 Tax=Roseicyclus sediminis TaxID=2980997 RepID=UPI0021D12987|nr:LysR family transcriptional regulator [Roseibacterium sp. SDUM158016]MCU4652748.1 LysR family transcriptional regulator [Roseibacterium sp. SDUM158016]